VSLSLPPLELSLSGLPPSSTKASVSSRIDGRPLCWSNQTIRLGIAGGPVGGLQKGGEHLPFFKEKKKKGCSGWAFVSARNPVQTWNRKRKVR
jgi:hypothetical protein